MKKIALAFTMLITLRAQSQMSASMRAGYSFKTTDVFLTPGLNYTIANTVTLGGEMMVNLKQAAPVNFGFKASYQYKFIEVGSGIWAMVYSTDGVNNKGANDNKFAGSVFVAAHLNKFFIQYEYLDQSKISIGVRENL